MARGKRGTPEVNASSMADIAFLLLIFFLVTTTIASDKGLTLRLPPKRPPDALDEVKLKDRNVFNVLVNSNNQLLVEEELMDVKRIKEEAKKFIMNNGRDEKSSESPDKAVISLKHDRGTKYEVYISVMDELKKAYNELRAEYMGITVAEYLDMENEEKKSKNPKLEEAKLKIPYQLSEAEPTNVGGN
ncbi:MAG: biopolymer transporter ExbD [Thermoflexibacter sp.]|nr:biopolymer transporter ExbD [Thermoflexibacter sp.]